jgi:cytohesin
MLKRFSAARTVLFTLSLSLLPAFYVLCQTSPEAAKENSKSAAERPKNRDAHSRYYEPTEEELANPLLQGADRERALSRRASLRLVVMISGQLDDTPTIGAGIIFGRGQDKLFVVTANHLIRRASVVARGVKVKLWDSPGLALDAMPTPDFDAESDVAVLEVGLHRAKQIDPCSLFMFQLSDGGGLKRGDNVYGVGNPQGFGWGMSATPEVVAALEPDRILFQSTFLSPGHSGGALLNNWGDLVGIIQSDQPPYGVARRLGVILQKLRDWKYIVELYQPRKMEVYEHDVRFESVLEEAVAAGSLTLVRSLLAACPDVNATNFHGRTPILIASMYGQVEIVRFLVGLGADMHVTTNSTGEGGVNALELAAIHGHAEVVKALLQAGADPTRGEGTTPLHSAVAKGHVEVIKVLGTNPAWLEVNISGLGTPLHVAVREKQLQAVKTLLDLGASPNSRNEHGRTPLHFAVDSGVIEIVEILLKSGADPTVTDDDRRTPLALAHPDQRATMKELFKFRRAK